MAETRLDQYIESRKRKLEEWRKLGINPYPYRYERTHTSEQVKREFDKVGESPEGNVSVAGRLVAFRELGKISFGHIQDQEGKIQVVFKKDELGDKFKLLKLVDVGDFLGVTGPVFRTKRGEISVLAKNWEMLAKSIRPLPEKYHGIKDIELKYRKRYLDLIMNRESFETFIKRSQIIKELRAFLDSRGFLEVETPILEKVYGGAAARPFITHLNYLDMDLFLRISLEIPLKKLLVGGYEKVYQIGKVFRNESIDSTHNPEFTELEIYWAYTDYNDMMNLTEEMFNHVADKIIGKKVVNFRGHEIRLDKFQRLPMAEAFKKYAGEDFTTWELDQLVDYIERERIPYDGKLNRADAIDLLWKHYVEDNLIQPTFVIDYPWETTPLCKYHRSKPGLIERAELFVGGMEFLNIYSELNDPIRQKELLELQARERASGVETANPYDEDFVEALEIGMPPASGFGMGVDRFVMLMLEKDTIKDVILFPFVK